MINKADNRFLFIDTETGGLIPGKHSLLSIGCVIWDKDQGVLAQKEFFVKSKRYYVTQKAREINKFDRKEHNKSALEPKVVIEEMLNFARQYFNQGIAIPLAGHNINFDVNFIKVFFSKNNRSYNQYFSHRTIDTYSVFKTLVLAGKIDITLDSSADAFKYFKIKVNDRHSALGDCLATVELYENLINILK